MDVPRLAQPILEDLSAALGETCHLGTLEGNHVRFLAVAEPDVAVRVVSRLGKTLPAHCTSTGKALLAEMARLALARGFGRIDWTAARDDERLLRFYEGLGAKQHPEKVFFRLTGEELARLAKD